MAKVSPFHGYRYNSEKIQDINKVVTQPYDKIDESKQEQYYNNSDYNIVRLILGKNEGNNDRYQKAAEYLQNWIDQEILIREKEPCFYAYWQEYNINGKKMIRKGFVGMGKLEGEDGVKAHENTMEGPKADRLNLMRATEANFGHIFMLYNDPVNKIIKLLDKGVKNNSPLNCAQDEDGNYHKLWKINEPELITAIKQQMKDKTLYIADGHHRYQTALNYRNECRKKGWESVGPEGFDNRMMTFINIDDPGMNILATHRLVYGLNNFTEEQFLKRAKSDFIINKFNTMEELYNRMDITKENEHVIGFRTQNSQKYYALTLKNESLIDDLLPDKSKTWRDLDVVILHKVILEGYLNIDEKALAEKKNIEYIRYRDQALNILKKDKYQAAFLLNPTPVLAVKKVADKGERMPQKSTDFYPKLLTGLVINKLGIKKEKKYTP